VPGFASASPVELLAPGYIGQGAFHFKAAAATGGNRDSRKTWDNGPCQRNPSFLDRPAGYDGACHRAAFRADLMGYLAIAVPMSRQPAG
jgi:hypothetical protein